MSKGLIALFIWSSGCLLLLTAVAKLISISGSARVLDTSDPIFSIPFRQSLGICALAELSVAAVCLFVSNRILQAGLIALLATNFVLYRFGLYWVGYGSACPCLGNFTDALHIAPHVADTAMKAILVYLFVGGYGILFCCFYRCRIASVCLPSA